MHDENNGSPINQPAATPPLDEKINPDNVEDGPDLPSSTVGNPEPQVEHYESNAPPRSLVAHRLEMLMDEQISVSRELNRTFNIILGIVSFLLGIALFLVFRNLKPKVNANVG